MAALTNTGWATATQIILVGSATTWSSTTAADVVTVDGTYATSTLASGNKSRHFRGYDMGFSVPADATVEGVEYRVYRGATGTDVRDFVQRLTYNSLVYGDDNSEITNWAGAIALTTYGSPTYLWNAVLTPAIVNDSTFGYTIRTQTTLGGVAQLDKVDMRVWYRLEGYTSTVTL